MTTKKLTSDRRFLYRTCNPYHVLNEVKDPLAC